MAARAASGGFVVVETTLPASARGRAALRVAAPLVERRLAACVNLVGAGATTVRSVYRWRGRVVLDREVVAVFKTTRRRLPELVAALRAVHPYEVPYIGVFALDVREPAYARWLRAETRAVRRSGRARPKRQGPR